MVQIMGGTGEGYWGGGYCGVGGHYESQQSVIHSEGELRREGCESKARAVWRGHISLTNTVQARGRTWTFSIHQSFISEGVVLPARLHSADLALL